MNRQRKEERDVRESTETWLFAPSTQHQP